MAEAKTRAAYVGGLAVLLTGCALLSASFLHDRPLLMSDTLTYVEGARSLARGDGYTEQGSPITVRPPGYSAVLVPLIRVGADSIRAFKVLNILLACLALAAFVAALRPTSGRGMALLVAAACGVSYPWVYYTHAVLSEMLFVLLTGVLLAAAVRHVERPGALSLWAMASAALLLPLVRFAGVAFWPALVWVLWVAGRVPPMRRSAGRRLADMMVVLTVVLAPLALYLLRNALRSGQVTSYDVGVSAEYALTLQQIGITDHSLWTRLWVNARGYLHILLVPDQAGIAQVGRLSLGAHLACVTFWLLCAAGAVRHLRSRAGRVFVLVALCYGGLLMVNTWYDMRYLLPVLPLCFWFAADGFGAAAAWAAGRLVPWGGSDGRLTAPPAWAGAFLALLLIGNAGFTLVSPKAANLRSREYTGLSQRLYEAAVFLKSRPEPGRVLVAGGPGFVHMWSGRRVLSVLSWLDHDRRLTVTALPPDVAFVLLDESEFAPYRQEYLEPLIEANRNSLDLIFEAGRTQVYGRRPMADSAP